MSAPENPRESPLRALRFRWPWRDHQLRVLAAIDAHLNDGKLHIVAAPGAGKTSLGLEVVRRLERPAWILAPTIAIRDQWILRLKDFLQEPGAAWPPTWCSTDADDPAYLTAVTYQAIWSRLRDDAAEEAVPREEDAATLAEVLERVGTGTLVLDEAHHLHQEWWRAISEVCSGIEELTLVSLTATPPYDVSGRRWSRYEELCGPIDEEVTVPELVRAGTLAPHQDHVFFVSPGPDELRRALERDRDVETMLADLSDDREFTDEVRAHPWVEGPDVARVLENPEFGAALLVFLEDLDGRPPLRLMELMELRTGEIPPLDTRWWEVLLAEYLFGSSFEARTSHVRDRVATELRTRALLWRRELRIHTHRDIERCLLLSAAKVEACVDVYRAERQVRGEDLRLAILTDFIRDEALAAPPGDVPVELGAFPVFDAIVTSSPHPETIALLTGRRSMIHEAVLDRLPGPVRPETEPAPHRPGWRTVVSPDGSSLARAFTRLLCSGDLKVVIGTRGLLGQGWDAPCLNSVVLASYVGSFVSTNQMRGRVLRRDPDDDRKVASIWHLAALLPDAPAGVADFERLRERFQTFTGLSANGRRVESGLERLELPPVSSTLEIPSFNRSSTARLESLDRVREDWNDLLSVSSGSQVRPTVSSPPPRRLRSLHVRRTVKQLVLASLSTAAGFLAWRLIQLSTADSAKALGVGLLATAVGLLIRVGPELVDALRLSVLHFPPDGSLRQMATALLRALQVQELVESQEEISVALEWQGDGTATVSLIGGSFYEQGLFADSMLELLGPIENPRYLVTRPGRSRRWITSGREDVHAVPTILGTNRKRAESLLAAWRRHVAPGELVYTRQEGGRGILLGARARSFSTNFDRDSVGRSDRWQ